MLQSDRARSIRTMGCSAVIIRSILTEVVIITFMTTLYQTEGVIGQNLARKVITFPTLSKSSYVMFNGTYTVPDMTEMSVCLWVRIPEPIAEHIYTFVSYATPDNANEMIFKTPYRRDGTSTYRFHATITKRRFVFTEDPGFKEWIFWCFTWRMNPESWHLYLDGSQIIGAEERNRTNDSKMIQGGGMLILGQDQDEVGGGFALYQAFQGSLTEFNLWNRFITKQEIGMLMQSTCTMDDENSIISWKGSVFDSFGVTESDQDTWNIQNWLNQAPYGGNCEVSGQKEGSIYSREVQIECYHWKDEGNLETCPETRHDKNSNTFGLSFELRIRDKLSQNPGQLLHSTSSSSFPILRLPSGKRESNFTLDLLLKIIDMYGEYAEYNMSVQVYNLSSMSEAEVKDIIHNLEEGVTAFAANNTTDVVVVLNKIYSVAEIINRLTKAQLGPLIKTVQKAKSLLMNVSYSVFNASSCSSECLEKAAQTLLGVSSFRHPNELLQETQVTGAKLLHGVVGALDVLVEDDNKLIVFKVTTDLFESASNIISANHVDFVNKGDLKCGSTDSLITSLTFDAIDACLNKSLSTLGWFKEKNTYRNYEARQIQARVSKYTQQNSHSNRQVSKAGGFFIPKNTNTAVNTSTKFIGSATNPKRCLSPMAMRLLPVVILEIFDRNGHSAKTRDTYIVNVTNVNPKHNDSVHLHASVGDRIDFSVNVTIPFQVLVIHLDSQVTDLSYEVYQCANKKPNKTMYDNYWNIPSGSAKTMKVNATSDIESNSFMIDVAGNVGHGGSHSIMLSLSHLSCLYWDEHNQRWQTDGCWPDTDTSTDDFTICVCNHLTSFTAAHFVVPVNDINFGSVFNKDITQSPVVLATVITFFVVYVGLAIIMRRKDKEDLRNWRSAPQIDNTCDEQYFYRITVFTGLRPSSGTTSPVTIQLFGDSRQSRIIHLVDKKRRLNLKRGSICSFLVSERYHLGPIRCMDIDLRLSDAKGYDKWYLERIEIVDEQTKERFNFMCYDWITRVDDQEPKNVKLTVSEEGHFLRFVHLLSSHIRIQIYDEYMWGSLMTRQMPSNFTRVQRLSCCAALLCLTMIVNAMFYETEDKVQSTKTLKIASQSLSLGTVYIALISSLVTLPVSITMVTLFKKSRRNIKITPTTNIQITGRECKKSANVPQSMTSRWYRIIAWILVYMSSFVSTFFVILYSLEWGPEKSKRWLIAELTSLISSAALVDPCKAITFAVVYATLLKLRKKPFVSEPDDVYRQGYVKTNTNEGQ